MLDKLLKTLTRIVNSSENSSKLDKIFLYLEEQITLLKESRSKQNETFSEIRESIRKPDPNPVKDAL